MSKDNAFEEYLKTIRETMEAIANNILLHRQEIAELNNKVNELMEWKQLHENDWK